MAQRTAHNTKILRAALVVAFAFVAQVFLVSPALAISPTPDDTWMTNGTVFDTELSADGNTLYVGGKFTVVRENPSGQPGATVAAKNLAAIDVATGNMIRTWRPQVTGEAGSTTTLVRELAFKNGKLYVGGTFTAVNGQPRTHLAAVDATTADVDPSFAPNVVNTDGTEPLVYALETDDSRLYVGGRFSLINNRNRGKLAAFDLASGAMDLVWKPKTGREVMDLQMSSDGASIFAVGRFGSVTGSDNATATRKNVARFDTATGNIHPWTIPAGVIGETEQTAHDVLVTPTRMYAGFGDKGPNYVAAFRLDDGDTGSQIWRYGTVGDVQSMALSPGGKRLFFGGHFGINRLTQTVCNGKPLRGIGAINPNTGQVQCDWNPQIEPFTTNGNGPWDMTVAPDGNLWIGGGFTGISGTPQANLARFSELDGSGINQAPKVDLDGPRAGGLDATYFDNADLTGTSVSRVDPAVDFNFGNGSPASGIGQDTFSARYTGQVQAPTSGEYTFTTTSDDGVRLFVDGKLLVDNWTDHGPTDDSGTVTLEAGKRYDVALDYYENGGGAVIRLLWQPPGGTRQVIPTGNLLHAGGTNYATTFTGGPTPAVDDANLTVHDADDANIRSATVTLTNPSDGAAESLGAVTAGTGITAAYNAQTGVLALGGAAPKADYQKVLSSVAYNNGAASPTAGDRRVTFVINDGTESSVVAASTVTVQGGVAGP